MAKSLNPHPQKDCFAIFMSFPLWLLYVLTFVLFAFAYVDDPLLGWVGVILCLIQLNLCRKLYPPVNGDFDPLILGVGRAIGFACAASGFFDSQYEAYSGAGFMLIGVSYFWWLKFHRDLPMPRLVFMRFLGWVLIFLGFLFMLSLRPTFGSLYW